MEDCPEMTKENGKMNSFASDLARFNNLARRLERSERRRAGTNLMQARRSIAQRLGITPDQIENYRSLRNKVVPYRLMNKFRDALEA